MYRCDNKRELSQKSRGGGVLIALTYDFQVLRNVECFNTALTDAILVVTNFNNLTIVFCCVYVCPDSPLSEYDKFYDFCTSFLDSLNFNFKLIICGDFNISNYYLLSRHDLSSVTCKKFVEFINFLEINNLKQGNTILNENEKLLDLVLSNVTEFNVDRCMFPILTEDAHHPSLDITFKFSYKKKYQTYKESELRYDYKRANFMKLYQLFEEADFQAVYNQTDPELACTIFYKI